ncbi:putative holocytochrome c synthase [Zopfochytrium polystomum]|nr:putative holocytochrome c synthase [Zopfochytrium polystomum]
MWPFSSSNNTGAETGTQQPPYPPSNGSGCPVDHSALSASQRQLPPNHPGCPVDHKSLSRTTDPHGSDATTSILNPANMMPAHSDVVAEGQRMPLDQSRELSSIPKGKGEEGVWEYPSPQGFYNALKRKGKEAPEENIPMMVAIHNFLNEACWDEIKKWEEKYHCDCKDIRLIKFRGRPDELSPKARLVGMVYGTPKPFDRHDWTVDRCGKPVRYVIDYYGAPDEGDMPVFHADVRPALDSPSAIFDRARDAASGLWDWVKGSSSQ